MIKLLLKEEPLQRRKLKKLPQKELILLFNMRFLIYKIRCEYDFAKLLVSVVKQ